MRKCCKCFARSKQERKTKITFHKVFGVVALIYGNEYLVSKKRDERKL